MDDCVDGGIDKECNVLAIMIMTSTALIRAKFKTSTIIAILR